MEKTINGILLLLGNLIEFAPIPEQKRLQDFFNAIYKEYDAERKKA